MELDPVLLTLRLFYAGGMYMAVSYLLTSGLLED